MPVQRLPRYKMLLEDYIKHLGTGNRDEPSATAALDIIADVASSVNEAVRAAENLDLCLAFQRRVGMFFSSSFLLTVVCVFCYRDVLLGLYKKLIPRTCASDHSCICICIRARVYTSMW